MSYKPPKPVLKSRASSRQLSQQSARSNLTSTKKKAKKETSRIYDNPLKPPTPTFPKPPVPKSKGSESNKDILNVYEEEKEEKIVLMKAKDMGVKSESDDDEEIFDEYKDEDETISVTKDETSKEID